MIETLLYEHDQIKPEWRAQDNTNSYQVSIRTAESGSPYTSTVELVNDGDRINPDGEDNAHPGDGMLRMYAGLNDAGSALWDYQKGGN